MKRRKEPYWLVRTLCLLCVLAIGFATTIATTDSDDEEYGQDLKNGKFLGRGGGRFAILRRRRH